MKTHEGTCGEVIARGAELDGEHGTLGAVESVAGPALHQVEDLQGALLRRRHQVVARRVERQAVDGALVDLVELQHLPHARLVDLDDAVGQCRADARAARVEFDVVGLGLFENDSTRSFIS